MIRKLEGKDIDRVMDIWLKSTTKAHYFISPEYWKDNYNKVKNEYIPKSKTFVCQEENDIKGFISIISHNYIGALFVAIENQGHGVGEKLLNYVKKDYESLVLSAYSDNFIAVNFYKKNDFKVVYNEINDDTKLEEFFMKWEK